MRLSFRQPLAALMVASLWPAAVARPADPQKPKPPRPLTAAESKPTAPSVKTDPWRPIFVGVELARTQASHPRPLQGWAVRIDLKAPGVEFFVTPSNGDAPKDTDGLKTSTFLKKHKLQLAINASPYDVIPADEGVPLDVAGLSISRGDRYSPPNDTYGALLISKDNRAWIATPPMDTKAAYNAVGGFRLLLEKGRNVGWHDQLHPRTAVGVSRDGRYLYLLVIDGRQSGYSEGTTTAETAEWMRLLGAYDALNLDGGGSTALVIDDGQGGAKVLNRPIHLNIVGNERVNANHLGVYARRLTDPPRHGPE